MATSKNPYFNSSKGWASESKEKALSLLDYLEKANHSKLNLKISTIPEKALSSFEAKKDKKNPGLND